MVRRPNKSTGTSTDSGIYSQERQLKCDTIADIRDVKMTHFYIAFYDTFHPDGSVTSFFIIEYYIEGTVLFSCEKLSCTTTCRTDAPREGVTFAVTGEIHSDDINSDIVASLLLARKQYEKEICSGSKELTRWRDSWEEKGRERAKETGEPNTRAWIMHGHSSKDAADMGWISDPQDLPNWDGDWSSSMRATSDAMKMFKSKFPQSMNDTLKDMKGQGNEGYSALDWLADLGVQNPDVNWLCYCLREIRIIGDYDARSSLDSLLSRD